MIRKLLFCLAAVVGLFAFNTSAADADPPPGWFYLAQYDDIDLSHDGCSMRYVHGQYGSNAFVQITMLNGGCSDQNGARVYGWGAQSTFCTWYREINFDYPDCGLSNFGATLTVTTPATLVGGVVRLGPLNNMQDLYFCPCP